MGGKRRKNGREKVGGFGEVGSGADERLCRVEGIEGNRCDRREFQELRRKGSGFGERLCGIESSGVVANEGNGCGVAVVKHEGKCEDQTENGELERKGSEGKEDLGVELGEVKERGNKDSFCEMVEGEQLVRETGLRSGVILVKHEEGEGVGIEKDINVMRENVVLKRKRSKQKREYVGRGEQQFDTENCLREVPVISSSHFEKCEDHGIVKDANVMSENVLKEGKRRRRSRKDVGTGELSCFLTKEVKKGENGVAIDEFRHGEGKLSKGVSLVKQEKCEAIGEVTVAGEMEGKMAPKVSKSRRKRENAKTSEVLRVESSELEDKGQIGACQGIDNGDVLVEEVAWSKGVSVVKHEEHNELKQVKDADIMKEGVALKGKRSKRKKESVGTDDVSGVLSLETLNRNDGNLYEVVSSEENRSQSGLALAKHKKKHRRIERREVGGKTCSSTVVNDDVRVLSPFFVKADNDHGGFVSDSNKKLKKKHKSNKTIELDLACENSEAAGSTEVVSPYFRTESTEGKSSSEGLEKKIEEKGKKKRRGSKKARTFIEQVEVISNKKVKEKLKNKRVHLQHCRVDNIRNNGTCMNLEGTVSSDLRIEVEKEAECERGPKNLIAGPQSGLSHAAGFNLNGGSVVSDLRNSCVSYIEPEKATCLRTSNVRKKRVKAVKIDNNKDDPNAQCDEEGCKMVLSRTIKKSNKKQKTSVSSKIYSQAKDDGVPDSSLMENGKEDFVLDKEDCLHASETKKVSPYFEKPLVNEDFGAEVDEFHSKSVKNRSKSKIDKSALEEIDRLLSKYAYKSENMPIGAERNLDEDGVQDEVIGSKPVKKSRRAVASTTFTRAEKLAEAYRRKDPNNRWKPPSSPYNLLQEEHFHDPWRVLVICMLLNLTTGAQVRKVLCLFFQRWPNAQAAIDTNPTEIAIVISSLGLHRKRAVMIQRFSREYLSDDWTHVTQLHGIGKYAADAYAIFCNGMWDQVKPNDHMLNYYWKFLQKRVLRAREIWQK